MFYAKMHDDEDDELPRYEEEEEGLEQPHDGDIIEEVEEIVVEAEPGEDEVETPAAPAPKSAPAAKKKAKKAAPKKKAKAKAKAKPKKKAPKAKKKAAKKSSKRKKR
jgi:ATPase subunit of ABC transporter with duplicated ATPase domains